MSAWRLPRREFGRWVSFLPLCWQRVSAIDAAMAERRRSSTRWGSGDDDLNVAVRAALVELLYQQGPLMVVGNLVTGAAMVAFLYGRVASPVLFGWALVMALWMLPRWWLVLLYRKRQPAPTAAGRWGWATAVFSAGAGAIWGSAALLFLSEVQTGGDYFLMVIFPVLIMGLNAIGTVSLASFMPASVGFALSSNLLLILALLRTGEALALPLIVMVLIGLASNLKNIRMLFRVLEESLCLRFENQQLRHRAEQATIAKTRFLAAASHDLRQPVQALELVHKVLEERARGGDLQPLVGQLGQGIDALDGLLGNLLHISKLEAGLETPNIRSIAVGPLFDELAAEFSMVAAEHNDRLHFRPTTAQVVSDRYMLTRILSNLVANAIKYTHNGRILVVARRRGDQLRIGVYDNGPGVPDAYLARIFEEFQQVHNPQRDRSQGLGLGLAIVRRTADLLGHRIEVDSRVSDGSCFSVWVPLAVSSEGVEPPRDQQQAQHDSAPDQALAGRRLWVIDDDPIVSRAMAALLEHWGCRVKTAEDLDAALALTATGEVPDALLVDYRLPGGVTGLEVIGQLFERFGRRVPTVLVTGDTAPERLREATAGGFPLLHKPASPELLRATLLELLGDG